MPLFKMSVKYDSNECIVSVECEHDNEIIQEIHKLLCVCNLQLVIPTSSILLLLLLLLVLLTLISYFGLLDLETLAMVLKCEIACNGDCSLLGIHLMPNSNRFSVIVLLLPLDIIIIIITELFENSVIIATFIFTTAIIYTTQ